MIFVRRNLVRLEIISCIAMISFLAIAFVQEAYAPTTAYTILWLDWVPIADIAVSGNGQYVASVEQPGTLRFNDRSSETALWNWTATGETLLSVAISRNGDCVAVGSNQRVYFWVGATSLTGTNPTTNPTWNSTSLGAIERRCLAMSDDGNYLAACGTGYYAYYWRDTKGHSQGSSNVQTTWTYSFGQMAEAVDISSDGDCVAVGTKTPSVAYWKRARTLTGHGLSEPQPDWLSTKINSAISVVDVAISDDGNYVAAVSHSVTGELYYWASAKALEGDPTPTWHNELWGGSIFDAVAISGDGNSVVAGATSGVYFWSGASQLDDVPSNPTPDWVYTTDGLVKDVAINSAGEYIAAATDSAAYFLNSTGSSLWNPPYVTDALLNSMSLSEDGGTLAMATVGSTAHVLDTGFRTTSESEPVGGILMPVDIFALLWPYLLAVGLAFLATIALVYKRRIHVLSAR